MDRFTPEALEQLARSIAMSPTLGQRDRQAVIDALRRLAEIERGRAGVAASSPVILDILE